MSTSQYRSLRIIGIPCAFAVYLVISPIFAGEFAYIFAREHIQTRARGYVDVPFTPEYVGKHYVTAICQYKDSSSEWTDSTIKTKTFSFAVASLK